MTRQNPAANDSMRITGYGVDTGVDNKTLQTSAGPYVGEYTGGAATNIYHRYQVDTRERIPAAPSSGERRRPILPSAYTPMAVAVILLPARAMQARHLRLMRWKSP